MPYNQHNYNEQRYNINGVYYPVSLTETVTGVDSTQLADYLKSLAEALAETDTIVFTTSHFFMDLTFLDDFIQIQFANKALSDTVRLADWLSIERTPFSNAWYD